jgi:hypothetical protein
LKEAPPRAHRMSGVASSGLDVEAMVTCGEMQTFAVCEQRMHREPRRESKKRRAELAAWQEAEAKQV